MNSPSKPTALKLLAAAFGLLLAGVSGAALFGMRSAVNTPEKLDAVRQRELMMIETKTATGEIKKDEHKMYHAPEPGDAPARESNQHD